MSESAQIWLLGAGVSEESERVGSGLEGNGGGVDPTALSLALAGASREKADAFLDNQNALIADQRKHLHEQNNARIQIALGGGALNFKGGSYV